MTTFWERLDDALTRKGIKAAELGRQIGISQASINGWKNGSCPKADAACAAAKVLGTTVEWLISGEEPGMPPELARFAELSPARRNAVLEFYRFQLHEQEHDEVEKNQAG